MEHFCHVQVWKIGFEMRTLGIFLARWKALSLLFKMSQKWPKSDKQVKSYSKKTSDFWPFWLKNLDFWCKNGLKFKFSKIERLIKIVPVFTSHFGCFLGVIFSIVLTPENIRISPIFSLKIKVFQPKWPEIAGFFTVTFDLFVRFGPFLAHFKEQRKSFLTSQKNP